MFNRVTSAVVHSLCSGCVAAVQRVFSVARHGEARRCRVRGGAPNGGIAACSVPKAAEQAGSTENASGQRVFSDYKRACAATLFVTHDWRVDAANDYVERLALTSANAEGLVETWALEEPLETMILLDSEEEAPRKSVHARARCFYVKWRLARWVDSQNAQGIAPPTASVLQQHDAMCPAASDGALTRSRADASVTRNKTVGQSLACRFRRSSRRSCDRREPGASRAASEGLACRVCGGGLNRGAACSRDRGGSGTKKQSLRLDRVIQLSMENTNLGPLLGPKNYHASHVFAGGGLVRLNLDETCILYFIRSGNGNVAMSRGSRAHPRPRRRPRPRARKCDLRAVMTHVVVICDNTTLQPKPPQVKRAYHCSARSCFSPH